MDIYDNLLSENLFQELRAFSRKGTAHRTNVTHWEYALIGTSGAIEIFDLSNELVSKCKAELRKRIRMEFHDQDWFGSIHLGCRLSYIPWHSDDNYILAITCYLNETWDKDYGGYFLYEDSTEYCIKAIPPQRNIGLIYEPPLMHAVALCNIGAPLRESLQIFIRRRHAV